ncbi:MAG: MerR family DNA-binding protein [Ramlibacter sp.]|nr:MerR family DNA-binding protein [Ramlibacter sp.]
MEQMTIGQLAALACVNVETVRYYQRRGLLSAPDRPAGSIRRYAPAALTRLRFIKRAQSLGFSLDDVHALLSLDDGQTCSSARRIAEHKLEEVRDRVACLQVLEGALEQLVKQCARTSSRVSCPLIETLASGSDTGITATATGRR